MSLLHYLENNGYPNGWESFFEENISLIEQVDNVINKKGWEITPEPEAVFKVYELIRPENIKVIIMGMDPYYNGTAMGLAFSVSENAKKIPPSLQNIFKVIKKNTNKDSICYKTGNLVPWANQGVFLLNASLTATLGKSGGCGRIWDGFIKRTLEYIFKQKYDINPLIDSDSEDEEEDEEIEKKTKQQINLETEMYSKPVTLLWGRNAQIYEKYCNGVVLMSSHPSPLSFTQGFSECNHFNDTNIILRKSGRKEINW